MFHALNHNIFCSPCAGNSFASTTAQVNLLAALVHGTGWGSIKKNTVSTDQLEADPHGVKRSSGIAFGADVAAEPTPQCKAIKPHQRERKRKLDEDNKHLPNPPQPVLKRCRLSMSTKD